MTPKYLLIEVVRAHEIEDATCGLNESGHDHARPLLTVAVAPSLRLHADNTIVQNAAQLSEGADVLGVEMLEPLQRRVGLLRDGRLLHQMNNNKHTMLRVQTAW